MTLLSVCGRLLSDCAGHRRDRRSVDIRVRESYLVSEPCEGYGEVYGYRRLAYAAFS
jgi:hypothetical protein